MSSAEGYLSAATMQKSVLGSAQCPWRIRQPQGLTVRLISYNVLPPPERGNSEVCVSFAMVREAGDEQRLQACGRDEPEKVVFTSKSNIVDVEFIPVPGYTTEMPFLLKFSGNCQYIDLSMDQQAIKPKDYIHLLILTHQSSKWQLINYHHITLTSCNMKSQKQW